MVRLMSVLLLIALWNSYPLQSERPSPVQVLTLEGAYEFVSETTVLTKPKKSTEYLSSSEWIGLFLFKDGHFSQTMMKKDRPFWLPHFPRKPEGLGYGSAAGVYTIEGKTIHLTLNLLLSPHYVGQPWVLEYQLEKETLTLIETFHPNPHNDSEGQRTIVLRRARAS